jgi:hypothetical protein
MPARSHSHSSGIYAKANAMGDTSH